MDSEVEISLNIFLCIIGYGTPVAYANAANNLLLRSYIQAKIDEEKDAEDDDDPFADDDFFEDFASEEPEKPKLRDPSEYGISVWTHPMNLTTAQTAKQGGQVRNLQLYDIYLGIDSL